jgi:GntR family transcriptional regulator / MocR family aminotransferase
MEHGAVGPPLAVSREDPVPLAAQLAGQLRAAMASGQLAAGERLPATRALAAELGVSRTVIKGAYAQLFAEGWIEGRHGSGTFVAQGAQPDHVPAHPAQASGREQAQTGGTIPAENRATAGPYAEIAFPSAPGPVVDLRPGIPWTAGIDRAAWRRAWRTAAFQPPGMAADVAGLPELRSALTAYLRRARSIQSTPDQLLVTRGVADGLSLIATTLLRPGDPVGVEEPGYPVARAVLASQST